MRPMISNSMNVNVECFNPPYFFICFRFFDIWKYVKYVYICCIDSVGKMKKPVTNCQHQKFTMELVRQLWFSDVFGRRLVVSVSDLRHVFLLCRGSGQCNIWRLFVASIRIRSTTKCMHAGCRPETAPLIKGHHYKPHLNFLCVS